MGKNRLNRFLELPKEIDNKIPKITIVDFNEVLIENYKGILEYEEFFVIYSADCPSSSFVPMMITMSYPSVDSYTFSVTVPTS